MEQEKQLILEELNKLIETYYGGSFAQLVCEYIRTSGMTEEEIKHFLTGIFSTSLHETT